MRKAAALFEDFYHVLPKVLAHVVILVLGAYVRVARNAHDVLFNHLVGVEEPPGVLEHKLLGQDVTEAGLFEAEKLRQGFGDGDEAEHPLPFPLKDEYDVKAL